MSFVSHVASVSILSILDCPYSFLCCGILFCLSSSYVFKGQSRSDKLEKLATWETKDNRQGKTKQIPQQRKM
jgi:hypothetical protein